MTMIGGGVAPKPPFSIRRISVNRLVLPSSRTYVRHPELMFVILNLFQDLLSSYSFLKPRGHHQRVCQEMLKQVQHDAFIPKLPKHKQK
jgi:hypothetical protein